ncbi:MAG: amidohydrolase family protein [Rhodospirillales bacterium]|nr:amidohydrolase family protein [Rhodospirillales bacterium]
MAPGAVDIHTHIVPASFPAYAGRHANVRWPQMAAGSDCRHCNVMIAGKVFRTVSDECWSIERRLEAMVASRVARQILSPMPELLSYWLEPEDALALGRHINDTIADMIAEGGGRFAGLGTVPLQDPDLATRELERLMHSGKFCGVEIGTNVNGVAIGDARFESFFQAAEELGAAIFVHALHPAGMDRLVGPAGLAALVAFPCETAFAIASLITGGILTRRPKLKIAFSHGGGVFGLVLPRLMYGWKTIPELGEHIRQSPAEQVRKLFYDTLVYDTATLAFLIERFGVTQLCVGTDHPFLIQEPDPVGAIEALGLSASECDLLLFGNASRFLGERS